MPVADVLEAQRLLEVLDHAVLRHAFQLTDVAHAALSATGRRVRPVRSSCIMPCLISRVLRSFMSNKFSSQSSSDITEPMAPCSSTGGTSIRMLLRIAVFSEGMVWPTATALTA